MRVILGVTAGIAAYKAASLVRLFTESGHQVTVIPTPASLEFVGAATWEALSGQPVRTSVFEAVDQVNHVKLGQQADLVVVAPATADFLARAAQGQANDLLSNTLLVTRAPVLFAPAMHTEMWQHPATQNNIATLRSRGVHVLAPDDGRLTGADSGPGRLPEAETIYAQAMALLPAAENSKILAGKTVVVTTGGTQEPLDPVRYLGNRSSGKQGLAVALSAEAAGAQVILIAAHVDVPIEQSIPDGIQLHRVGSTQELEQAVKQQAAAADAIVMAAAVADYRPETLQQQKIKKRQGAEPRQLVLVQNPDILAGLVAARKQEHRKQILVGFAAETGDEQHTVAEYGRQKLERKGCDLLVVNDVSAGKVFGDDLTSVWIMDPETPDTQELAGSKTQVSHAIIERVAAKLSLLSKT